MQEKKQIKSIEKLRYIPKTGQKLVWAKYDDASLSGFDKDLEYRSENGMLTSNISNLQWQDSEFEEGVNDFIDFSKANTYCSNLKYNTKDDWRLPNIKELISTANIAYDAKSMFKNNSISGTYFSKSKKGTNNKGRTFTWGLNGSNYSVRCVRDINDGSIYPNMTNNNLISKSNDISYDPTLKLMFDDREFSESAVKAGKEYSNFKNLKEIESVDRFGDFEYAIKYCEELNTSSYDDWRLPNINELFYTSNKDGHQTFQNISPSMSGNMITSSNLYIDKTNHNWVISNSFFKEAVTYNNKTFFRCVRSMGEDKITDSALIIEANIEEEEVKRVFKVVEDKVDVSLPVEIFNNWSGIRLKSKLAKELMYKKSYQITNMYPEDEREKLTLVSVKKVGNDTELKDEIGYFEIQYFQGLFQKGNTNAKFKKGETYTIIINNKTKDITINLKLL